MELDQNLKICIIGLGLMGGSYAQALSGLGYRVGAIDVKPESLRYAQAQGWIADGRTEPDGDYLRQFDLMVFALYPHAFLDWLRQYQELLKPGTLLTDVTGVKSCVVYDAQALLRPDLEYIPAHPMAGRESSGVENACAEVFQNANYIVTPTERNTPEAIETCKALGRTLGFRTVTELTPEKHDEMIAFLSQLTHCIAVSLMTCRDTACLAEYSGDSFRDLTRIAKINDEMWSELFLANKTELLRQMDLFSEAFQKLRDDIANDRRAEMRETMRRSTAQRLAFDNRRKK